MKNYQLSLLLFGYLLLGCSTENIHLSREEKIKVTQVSDLSNHDIYSAQSLVKSGNTLITISPTNNFNAICLDLQTEQKNRFFRRHFSGDDNMFQIMSLNSLDGSTVTALDFRKGRLIETPIAPSLSRSENMKAETIISLPQNIQHLVAAKTSTFVIATGLYSEGRYLYYSLKNQNARYFLSYPDHPDYPNLKEETKAMLHASNILRIRQDESAFVCADMYSGGIDFCRITSGTIERVKMLRLHYPKVDISESPSTSVEYYKDNQLGFIDIAVSQEHVYALYSGSTYKELGSSAFESNVILVYDWEGKLLKSCTLDAPVTNICYDSTEKAVYGITNKSSTTLVRINI